MRHHAGRTEANSACSRRRSRCRVVQRCAAVIIISGHGDIAMAVRAMNAGAVAPQRVG